MSPKKSLLIVGLSALGLLEGSATRADDPGSLPAPPGQNSAPASKPTQMVLLLNNGKLLTGTITEEGRNYLVHQNGGTIPVPKIMVEKMFGSMAEIYPYKRACVPDRDPDERLKLAKWCLSQNMTAEALVELRAVVAVSPRAGEAQAMLKSLENSERRAQVPQVDNEVVRSGAEMPMASPRGNNARAAEMSPTAIARAQRDLGVPNLPVIFDLPSALAVKRADLFARDVHPILQMSCAKCHNEQYAGTFQLIEVKSRRGLSGDVLRANLDATLRLVDPENPARSQLLSSALVPHGVRSNPRPIFRGSNDPRYQIIAAWVKSLQVKRSTDGGVVPAVASAPRESAGFAVDRDANQGSVPSVTRAPLMSPPVTPVLERQPEVMPATRFVPGQGGVVERNPPAPGEFPLPPMLGGPLPAPSPGAAIPGPSRPESVLPMPVPRAAAANSADPALPQLPAATPKAKKPAAPLQIDPDLLERAILNRNGER